MTSPESTMNCPPDETLAAFADGRLDATARQEVMEHLADCAECRDIVLLAVEMPGAEATVVRPAFGRRMVAVLAVAAALALVITVPAIRERIFGRSGMSALVHVAESMDHRRGEARLSAPFPYRQAKEATRGGADEEDYVLEAAVSEAAERADKRRTQANLHALGVAHLLAGNGSEAVAVLEEARRAGNANAALLSDVAAAYLAVADDQNALKAADAARAIEEIPAALWNRALALEGLDRKSDAALKAWNDYVDIDPDSQWAAEARKHIADLSARRP
jgi:hypothetical protein